MKYSTDILLRLPKVLEVFPVGRSTYLEGVRSGIYPQPVRLSPRCVAWRASEIQALIERIAGKEVAK